MRRPLTITSGLFFISVALLAFSCQWDGDIYLDDGPDSETTSEEAESNGTTDTDTDMDTDSDTGVDTETDTGTGTGIDTETDTGTGTDTGHLDTDTGTDTGTGESESDPDSETASDTQWFNNDGMWVGMSIYDYRYNDAPDDQICAYLFDASVFPDSRDINEREIDFSLAEASECMTMEFDPQWEFEIPNTPSTKYFFGINFTEDQLVDLVELEFAIAVGVLYYNSDTARALVPEKDYWGYSFPFEPENRGPNGFDLYPVRESPPENDH